ncbi:MAG: UbiD family decarboxylase [Alphaproteobacteria bacterium]|jgi:4-hydroxy-3-polyprenylbenzoate decarboxylase
MAYSCLRDFITALEKKGDLARVSAPVSPNLEMTEIQSRLIRQGGPAVIYENIAGPDAPFETPWPRRVLANLFGTEDRIAWALGREMADLPALGKMLAVLDQPGMPANLDQVKELWPAFKSATNVRPKVISSPPCQDVVIRGDKIDLAKLPIQTCWPGEPAPLITWPLVVTKTPDSDGRDANLGIYRMQVLGRDKTCMRWLSKRGGASHFKAWQDAGLGPMPAAAVIGADPATTIAAVTPVPEKISEYAYAGLLRGTRTQLAKCVTVPLMVPAHAEIVIEGHVSLSETAPEGPYGDHTGYYNSVEPFPVFTVSAITMRKDPIYLTTYTGRPPDEPSVLAQGLGAIFTPMIQRRIPAITDFHLPPEACSYRIAVVSINKSESGLAQKVMNDIWSALPQFMFTKMIIVVDDDIDIRNWADVMWAVATRMDPVRDITLIKDSPIDYLDFASPIAGRGGKAGLDATNKIGAETTREWGKPLNMAEDIVAEVTRKWADYGLDDPDQKSD